MRFQGNNSKCINAGVMVLAYCLMSTDIHIKFREDILNGFQVIEWTLFYDKVPREIIQRV